MGIFEPEPEPCRLRFLGVVLNPSIGPRFALKNPVADTVYSAISEKP
jgi:hypothetical protein